MSARTGRADLLLSRRACLPLLAAAMAASSAPAWAQGKSGFEHWVEAFRARARARGISDATYTRVMSNIKPDTAVFELNRSQPEFKEQVWQYLNRRVSDWRITPGKEKATDYASSIGTKLFSTISCGIVRTRTSGWITIFVLSYCSIPHNRIT